MSLVVPEKRHLQRKRGYLLITSSYLITPQPFNGAHSKLHSFWGRILNVLCLHFLLLSKIFFICFEKLTHTLAQAIKEQNQMMLSLNSCQGYTPSLILIAGEADGVIHVPSRCFCRKLKCKHHRLYLFLPPSFQAQSDTTLVEEII